MNWPLWTRRFIFFIVASVGLWDIGAAAFGGPGSTISLQLFHLGSVYPTIPFAVGYIFGHVFGRIDIDKGSTPAP